MNMFCNLNQKDLVPGIAEVVQGDKTPTSDPEDPLPENGIPDEEEISSTNENIK